jgi:hypothetical protein
MNEKLEKYINEDGMVGVLVSGAFGGAWSTWCALDRSFMCMDKTLVEMKLSNRPLRDVKEYLDRVFPGTDYYVSANRWRTAGVEWVEKGRDFIISEYDGAEEIVFVEDVVITP